MSKADGHSSRDRRSDSGQSDDDMSDAKAKKTKTFAIPSTLARWFDDKIVEEPSGVVKKSWLYNQYVQFCKEGNIKPKHKQIFSKLVFTVFPRAGSCRLGSIGSQVPYYFGIQRRKEKDKNKKPKKFPTRSSLISSDERYHVPSATCTVAKDDIDMDIPRKDTTLPRRSASMTMASWTETKTEGGKRKRSDKESTTPTLPSIGPMLKRIKMEEEKVGDADHLSVVMGGGQALKHRLLSLHRILSPNDADPYQTHVGSYLELFVNQFWPELCPLQWDLRGVDGADPLEGKSEREMNCYALCLCCALFCGSLVRGDAVFAKDMLMLCSTLVNSISQGLNGRCGLADEDDEMPASIKQEPASEDVQKNFGISLLFLARGLVDCSLFQNDMDAVVLAKSYCAMAAEIFP